MQIVVSFRGGTKHFSLLSVDGGESDAAENDPGDVADSSSLIAAVRGLENTSISGVTKLLTLFVSLAVFIAVGAAWWDMRMVLLIFPVLLFQESGHYVAMRWLAILLRFATSSEALHATANERQCTMSAFTEPIRPCGNMDFSMPPGPAGSWRPTLQLIRNPRAAMEGWVKRFGDPFLLNALNGPVVVTGRQDLIRTIHGQDPNIYSPFATPTIIPMMGSGSMLILEGETHRRERRLMMPMFHGDRMKAYGVSMQQIAIEHLEAHRARGEVLTLDLMTDISLETIVRTIFGGDDRVSAIKLMNASRRVVACSNPLLFFSRKSHVSFLGLTPWDRWQAAKKDLFRLLDHVVAERQNATSSHDDILSMLCMATYEDGQRITRDHLYAELLTFLFAGHETTALSLTWSMYHLHRVPESLTQLKQQLDSLDDESPVQLTSNPYLKAVVQETLRIHPIVTETLRKLNSPLQLGDYLLPAGVAVAPATVLAHHNPEIYPEPERFRPERFLERSYSPFEYMPFGGGHRRCIGAAFASYEMAIVLGTLLRRYEFELVETKPVVPKRRNVTIGPSSRVPVRVVRNR